MTQKQLSDHIDVDIKVVNRIVKGRSAVTPMVALKLAHAFKTSAAFWLIAAWRTYRVRMRILRFLGYVFLKF